MCWFCLKYYKSNNENITISFDQSLSGYIEIMNPVEITCYIFVFEILKVKTFFSTIHTFFFLSLIILYFDIYIYMYITFIPIF